MSRWRQGEHVAVIGMNGCGKTTLCRSILDQYRDWKIMFVSKPDDLTWRNWKDALTTKGINNRQGRSWRLIPAYERQRAEFKAAFDKIWNEEGWCAYIDEAYYVDYIGLESDLNKLLTQGRAKHISVMLGVQRPARVTRFALSEPKHIFCFRTGDRRDLKTIGEIVGDEFARLIPTLGKFEFAYLNKESGEVRRGNSRDPNGVFD